MYSSLLSFSEYFYLSELIKKIFLKVNLFWAKLKVQDKQNSRINHQISMSSFVFGDLLNGALLYSFSFGIPTSLSITLLIIATFSSPIPLIYFFCSFFNASIHSLKLKCSFFYENSIRFVLHALKSSVFSAIFIKFNSKKL